MYGISKKKSLIQCGQFEKCLRAHFWACAELFEIPGQIVLQISLIASLSMGFDLGGSPGRRVVSPEECAITPAVWTGSQRAGEVKSETYRPVGVHCRDLWAEVSQVQSSKLTLCKREQTETVSTAPRTSQTNQKAQFAKLAIFCQWNPVSLKKK